MELEGVGAIAGRAATRSYVRRAVASNLAMAWGLATADWVASRELVRNFMSSSILTAGRPRSLNPTMSMRRVLEVCKGLSKAVRVEASAGKSPSSF